MSERATFEVSYVVGLINIIEKTEHERDKLAAKVKVLEDAGTAILDFYNGPLEAKRPDVFQRLMVRLAAALEAGK